MTERKDLLAPVRELLSEPERWCKQYMALTDDGALVGSVERRAARWCLMGAVRKAYELESEGLILDELRRRLDVPSVSAWNDAADRTHADIMALLEAPFYGEST